MAANTWAEVPGNTLADIDPANDPAINPDYPGSDPWDGGYANIIDAWCGGCYDSDGDVLWLPLSGGHADYAGNQPIRISLRQDTCSWEMVRNPTGAIGNEGTLNDGEESSGVYFDGQPRAIHSYNKPVYVPGYGPVIAVQGNTYRSGQAGTAKVIFIDEETGLGTFGAANPAPNVSSGGGACWDSSREVIYWRGAGTGSIRQYDPATDTWSTAQNSGTTAISGYSGLAYSPELDCVLLVNDFFTDNFQVFNPDTGALIEVGVTGSPVGSALSGYAQPVWVEELGAFAWWNNSTDLGVINIITPGADPFVDDWAISQLTVSGATTPSAKTSNGTYGRFFYSRKLNGFGVINAVDEPIYFYALG
jgi:hypothetical protein